jgi:hypothetical protein
VVNIIIKQRNPADSEACYMEMATLEEENGKVCDSECPFDFAFGTCV